MSSVVRRSQPSSNSHSPPDKLIVLRGNRRELLDQDNGPIGRVYDDQHDITYWLLRLLGAGSYGRVYAATPSSSSSGITRNTTPTVALKEFFLSSRDQRDEVTLSDPSTPSSNSNSSPASPDREYRLAEARLELVIGQTIRRRLGADFCRQNVVCATQAFLTDYPLRAYLVFPFVEALDLQKYLVSVHYPSMREHRRLIISLGLPARTRLHNLTRQVARARRRLNLSQNDDERRRLREELEVYRYKELTVKASLVEIQTRALTIALQLVNTVARLHEARVYHRDLKPANLLVELPKNADESVNTLVADLGLSCVEGMDAGDEQFAKDAPLIECDDDFTGTEIYRDPISYVSRSYGSATRRETSAKYDAYSVGKILQRLFDERSVDSRGRQLYPIVRETRFMPNGVFDIIVLLTGETGYEMPRRPSLQNEEFVDEILDDDVRTELFNTRPSLSTVGAALGARIIEWQERMREPEVY